MHCVKTLIILPVAAFHLPIMPQRKRPDDLVTDPVHFQMHLEESRGFSLWVVKRLVNSVPLSV